MNRRLLIPLLVAVGLAVVVEYVMFFGGESDPPALESGAAALDAQAEEGRDPEAVMAPAGLEPATELAVASWLGRLGQDERTPFLTLAEAHARVPKHVVQLPRFGGTLWSRGRRIVWLDERPYVEGDHPGDFEVAAIEPAGVVLHVGGKPVRLSFSEGELPAAAAPEGDHAH